MINKRNLYGAFGVAAMVAAALGGASASANEGQAPDAPVRPAFAEHLHQVMRDLDLQRQMDRVKAESERSRAEALEAEAKALEAQMNRDAMRRLLESSSSPMVMPSVPEAPPVTHVDAAASPPTDRAEAVDLRVQRIRGDQAVAAVSGQPAILTVGYTLPDGRRVTRVTMDGVVLTDGEKVPVTPW